MRFAVAEVLAACAAAAETTELPSLGTKRARSIVPFCAINQAVPKSISISTS